ncbi:hypothetical protein ACIOVF_02920 [Pseudomonas sp. NPDC087612]|uniref:hypothetical protein n=1 Tax=Pseudomonas sp. NPDC087612 TaxID=3364441 RepID=UPI0037FBE05E
MRLDPKECLVMRLQSLLALAAASALLLPLGAHAGKLPSNYQSTCVAQAQKQGLAKDKAEQHCKCAGDVLQKNLSDKEMKDLDTLEDGVDAAVMERAQKNIAAVCGPKNPK